MKTYCGYCQGTGKDRCHFCSDTGRVQCNSCYGTCLDRGRWAGRCNICYNGTIQCPHCAYCKPICYKCNGTGRIGEDTPATSTSSPTPVSRPAIPWASGGDRSSGCAGCLVVIAKVFAVLLILGIIGSILKPKRKTPANSSIESRQESESQAPSTREPEKRTKQPQNSPAPRVEFEPPSPTQLEPSPPERTALNPTTPDRPTNPLGFDLGSTPDSQREAPTELRYEAQHQKGLGGCRGTLVLGPSEVRFLCAKDPGQSFSFSRDEVAKVHNNGVMLNWGKHYHFKIKGLDARSIESLFKKWVEDR